MSAFDAFYRDQYASSMRLAWLLCGSKVAAEDIVQEAMTAIYRRTDGLGAGSGVDAPAAYLRRAIVNGARTWHRDERRHRDRADLVRRERTGLGGSDPAAPDLPGGPDPAILDAIARLPYRQRVVIVARYWGDWSEVEIAGLLGCRTGTVKSLASRALDRLRKEIPDV